MTAARVWLPDVPGRPGALVEVDLEVVGAGPGWLSTPDVTVFDDDAALVGSGCLYDPALGGGPTASAHERAMAAAFGVVNTAFHAQRAMTKFTAALGRRLPHLDVKIGVHQGWGGGHYRMPATHYSDRTETGAIAPTGEVHLGRGRGFVRLDGQPYFHAPAHNPALVYHEVGHHLCRHTADFRLNRLRPFFDQTNNRTALEEGTCDYVSASLLGYPDIYGWHRAHVFRAARDRRHLDAPWTMADFVGGRVDPHRDGTVWSASLWAARIAAQSAGATTAAFDAAVARGLDRLGTASVTDIGEEALRRRRYLGTAAGAAIEAADDLGPAVAIAVMSAFAARGIHAGPSNAELRDRARPRQSRCPDFALAS